MCIADPKRAINDNFPCWNNRATQRSYMKIKRSERLWAFHFLLEINVKKFPRALPVTMMFICRLPFAAQSLKNHIQNTQHYTFTINFTYVRRMALYRMKSTTQERMMMRYGTAEVARKKFVQNLQPYATLIHTQIQTLYSCWWWCLLREWGFDKYFISDLLLAF